MKGIFGIEGLKWNLQKFQVNVQYPKHERKARVYVKASQGR